MFKILDCTLRDGGYYNSWDFDPVIVSSYLKAVSDSKIDYVELGLRNFPKSGFVGAFAYTTDKFLELLHLPDGPIYGVMVDAKTILTANMTIADAVTSLFTEAKNSKIGLVRVAAHFEEVESCAEIVHILKTKGYIVGFNLMQAGGKSTELIAEKAKLIKSWDELDVLYFADSLGNMDTTEVKRVFNALRSEWDGPIGIHTHNNMGQGLENTLTARFLGACWLDSTITGMGRGAGNTQTENLLAVLQKEKTKYNAKPIYELVVRYFEPMQKRYGWGSNLLYFLGAQNDVHPTYIQNLLSNSRYGTDEIVGAIDYLSNLEGTTSYNGAVLDSALDFTAKKSKISGDSSIKSILDGKEVLIITNGPSSSKYSSAIELYIESFKPVVISINVVDSISPELIDYYVISHNSKFLSDLEKYKQLNKSVILPKHRFRDSEMKTFEGIDIYDYGIEIQKGMFEVNDTFAILPYDNTTSYALAIILGSEVKSVTAIGVDGYELQDIRHQEMTEIFVAYNSYKNSIPITALTPTVYPIIKGSIYAYLK